MHGNSQMHHSPFTIQHVESYAEQFPRPEAQFVLWVGLAYEDALNARAPAKLRIHIARHTSYDLVQIRRDKQTK